MKNPRNNYSRDREWAHFLLKIVAALLLFETISGLFVYLFPFNISNQVMVLMHTLVGVILMGPLLWYQIRHWLIYRLMALNHYSISGYILMAVTMILVISGSILTFQAIFSSRISPFWDLIHLISSFGFIAFVILHVGLILYRDRISSRASAIKNVILSQNRSTFSILIILGVLFGTVLVWTLMYKKVEWKNSFPQDYSYYLGKERPFAPSLANTSTGSAFDPVSLGKSESCGTKGCHEEIYKEWKVSAHRYSAMDVGFQEIQKAMSRQNGPESTRYCAGCHDPVSLFAGTKNIYTSEDDLSNLMGYQEGVSCISCHAIKQTDIKGNANYVIGQPDRYMYELKDGKVANILSDFLIRAYPDYHIESLQHKLFKSPEFCAACHKQFIDEEVNNVGWVQLQNQYDKWKNSKWNHPGDPEKTIECRECHMPLMDSSMDPSSGDDMDYNRSAEDGKHRSHRFLGANQFMPEILDLEGAEEHIRLTEEWLRGEYDIPEIKDKWTSGPTVPLELILPEYVNPGDEVNIRAVLTNNKPGHDFPTGPIDIIQSWIEIIVNDQEVNEIFRSGAVDEEHFIQPGSFIFKVEPVDQYGNLIDKHNLWEMVGVRYNRSMFPGFTDQAEYSFSCPGLGKGSANEKELEKTVSISVPDQKISELHVVARLNYRKMDQFLINYMFGKDSGITAPITVMSEARGVIRVVDESITYMGE